MIHPDDQESAYEIFNRALAGLSQSTRMSFRQLSGDGNYEWWEYRTSVQRTAHLRLSLTMSV